MYLDLLEGLGRDKWKSVAIVPELDWLDDALRKRGIEAHLVPTHGSFDLLYFLSIARLVRRYRIDLIHTHLLTTSVYGSAVGALLAVPVVCTFHGPVDISADDRRLSTKLKIIARPQNQIVFVSDSLREFFVERTRLPGAQMFTVYNGIDTGKFTPTGDRAFRSELGVGSGDILVGAIGNVRPAKGYADFLYAAARLRQRSRQFRFVIVGDTRSPLFPELLRLRSELGLDDALVFTGFRDDVGKILAGLDAYVSSSYAEGFSLTTVQAMSAGVPVVATRSGGPEEIIRHGETGLLVSPSAPAELAETVASLQADPEGTAKLVLAAREDVVRRFDVATMIAGYERIYEQALGGASAREEVASHPADPEAACR